MNLKEIKNINQRIYELDVDISRNSKVIFIAALIFCLTKNKDFQNINKLTSLINFVSEDKKPIDQIIDLAKTEIKKLNLLPKTEEAVFNSLKTISGVNTNLDRDRTAFKQFISDFITKYFVSIKPNDLFLETLYMEIDKKAESSDKGVVLTPLFAAQLMIDLAEINYKTDVVADLCSGTGLFSLLAYTKMLNDIENDFSNKLITTEQHDYYHSKLFNSIIANDSEPKMVTLCLANFLLKSLNHALIFYDDVLNLQKSNFKIKNGHEEIRISPTKAILNPPYEDKYKPLEIVEKNLSLVKNENSNSKVVVIMPPQKFGQKKDTFSRILNIATLESVIKMQDDLFSDSGKSQPASIFVFNASKPHNKKDKIKYYDFTDTGYVYLKDSGLVDKHNLYELKKKKLLSNMKKPVSSILSNFKRCWNNFYEVNRELVVESTIDPAKVKVNKDEADITLENVIIKQMLSEKEALLNSTNNSFVDKDGSFEKYIVDILSEEQ